MLEVHPPHSSTHSWRDFFIHIGTIAVGLLLALEQGVEAIHVTASEIACSMIFAKKRIFGHAR